MNFTICSASPPPGDGICPQTAACCSYTDIAGWFCGWCWRSGTAGLDARRVTTLTLLTNTRARATSSSPSIELLSSNPVAVARAARATRKDPGVAPLATDESPPPLIPPPTAGEDYLIRSYRALPRPRWVGTGLKWAGMLGIAEPGEDNTCTTCPTERLPTRVLPRQWRRHRRTLRWLLADSRRGIAFGPHSRRVQRPSGLLPGLRRPLLSSEPATRVRVSWGPGHRH